LIAAMLRQVAADLHTVSDDSTRFSKATTQIAAQRDETIR
jgi:hypothetical protein